MRRAFSHHRSRHREPVDHALTGAATNRGSALILVLWCLLLLGMAVFGVVEMVELSVEHTTHRNRRSKRAGWR